MLSDLKKSLRGPQLTDPAYAFLLTEDTSGEVVSVHTETTSYDKASAGLTAVAAIKIRGNRILASQALRLTVDSRGGALTAETAIDRLLHFIGPRALVGFYLDFTVAIIDKYARPRIGIGLPNTQIEVSGLYYDRKVKTVPNGKVDLRLDSILRDLDLPARGPHSAFENALAAAVIYLRLNVTGRS